MVTKTDHDKDCEFRLDQGGSLCSCGFVKNKRVMTKADKILFAEICFIKLMNNGVGLDTKSPAYIKEKTERRSSPLAMFQSCGIMVRGRIKKYCGKWNIPYDKWVAEIEKDGK